MVSKKSLEQHQPLPRLPDLINEQVKIFFYREAMKANRIPQAQAAALVGSFLAQLKPGEDGLYSAQDVLKLRSDKENEEREASKGASVSDSFPLAAEWRGLGKNMGIEGVSGGDDSAPVFVDAGERHDGQGQNLSNWDPVNGTLCVSGVTTSVKDLLSLDMAFAELSSLLPGQTDAEKRAAFDQLQLQPDSDGILKRPQLAPIKAALSLKKSENPPEMEKNRGGVRKLVLLALLGSMVGGAYVYREHPSLQPLKDSLLKIQNKLERAAAELAK